MNRTLSKWIGTLAAGALAIGAQACVIRESPGVNRGYGYGYASAGVQGGVMVGSPSPYYVNSMPPEPLYETMTSSPGYGYVWIDGYWHWNGYEWVWMSGRWVTEQTGYVYITPYYDYDSGGGYVYYPGHWSRPDHVDSRVKVRDHRDGRPTTGYYPQHERPTVRDHRDDSYTPPASNGGGGSTVGGRDHRDNGGTSGGSTVGDHRGDGGSTGGGTTTGRDHRDHSNVDPPPPPARDTSDHRTNNNGGRPHTNVDPQDPPKKDTSTHSRGGNDHRSGGGATKPAPAPKTRPKTNVNKEAPRRAPQESPKRTAPKSNDHRRHSMLNIEGQKQVAMSGTSVAMITGVAPGRLLGSTK
jgi:hypothetical protein